MTYIDLINRFWRYHYLHPLNANETVLYFYLLQVNNACRWVDPFNSNNKRIIADLNISSSALYAARKRLKEVGLIDFISRNGSSTVWYTLFQVSQAEQTSIETSDQVLFEPDKKSDQVFGEINKIIKNKTKIKNKNINTNILPIVPAEVSTNKVNYLEILKLFNEMFAGKLPEIRNINDKRRSAVKARISQYGKESVKEVFDKVLECPFLLGDNDKNWRCDFDWIFKPGSYIKILEGSYNYTGKKKEEPAFSEQISKLLYEQF